MKNKSNILILTLFIILLLLINGLIEILSLTWWETVIFVTMILFSASLISTYVIRKISDKTYIIKDKKKIKIHRIGELDEF
uniref:Uncharacterized protein n=1 Tax=viral metagenome TaxID=1070528 RepID=A0A6M3LD27_9ZZZZ